MIIAIHQPNFLPWLPYFAKMCLADKFVLLDHVQYSKGGWGNRSSFLDKKAHTSVYLTVPIERDSLRQQFRDVRISLRNANIFDRGLSRYSSLVSSDSPGLSLANRMKEVLATEPEFLMALNNSGLDVCRDLFDIQTEMVFSSSLPGVKGHKGAALVRKICTSLGATTYLAGEGSKGYLHDVESSFQIIYLTDLLGPTAHQSMLDFLGPSEQRPLKEFRRLTEVAAARLGHL